MPVGVFVASANGKAYYINSRPQHLLGKGIVDNVTSEQLREAYKIYLAGSDRIYSKERDPILCALQGESVNIEDMEIRQADKIIPREVWGTPIYDQEENIAYAIAKSTKTILTATERGKATPVMTLSVKKYRLTSFRELKLYSPSIKTNSTRGWKL